MKVVFCAYDFPDYVGGPNAWLLRLLPTLRDKGVEIHVLFFATDLNRSPTVAALEQAGIGTSVFGFYKTTRRKIDWILQKIQAIQPNVFVPNLVIPAYFAGGWIRDSGIPTIGVLHSDDPFYHAIVDQFAQGGFFSVSALVCVSRFLQETAQSCAAASVQIHNVPCGVPLPQSIASPPSDLLRFIYAGRLEEEQKRISHVAQAFCLAAAQVDGCEGLIFGSGPETSRIQRIIEHAGVGDRVQLAGRVPSQEIQEHMVQSHVIVLLSDYEGLPIALMEGMACGLVPVCSRMESGIPELIEHNRNGLILEDRSRGFVEAIRGLKNDPQIWSRLSINARQTIQNGYSEEVNATAWNEFLHTCAKSASDGPRHSALLRDSTKLPRPRREFLREDFRTHHFVSRLSRKLSQWLDRAA